MAESFLQLEAIEQVKILRTLSSKLARLPIVLEKDVWVCWVLQALFEMPNRLQMAFKGGTSLSKVFGAIARFSEDVDITLDYRNLHSAFDPFVANVSKNQLKKFSDSLKAFVQAHTHDLILPYIHERLTTEFGKNRCTVDLSHDGERLRIYYPTVLESGSGGYIGNSVLVEFGARNITEPSQIHTIRPDIATHVTELTFPTAQVNVLSPMRTFWEKATLIHVECHRGRFRSSTERLSRHWIDLSVLADHQIGQEALADRALLADVIKHKKVFFHSSHANYDACLTGQLRLLPDERSLLGLRDDMQRMIDAGMFIGEPPHFDQMTERLRELESTINRVIVTTHGNTPPSE